MCQYWDNRLITEQYTDYFTDIVVLNDPFLTLYTLL